jgi:hypothetical protein
MIYKVRHLALLVDSMGTQYSVQSRYITAVDIGLTTNFQSDTELLLGVAPPPTAEITLKKQTSQDVAAFHQLIERDGDYRALTLYVFVSFDNGATYSTKFAGLVKSRKESYSAITLSASGFLDMLSLKRVLTPLMRWKKTATAIVQSGTLLELLNSQDPTLNNVGIINSILWDLGGRPIQCKSLFDDNLVGYTAKFYYDCDTSVIDPEWTWFNNENLQADLESLCRASGGVLFQKEDGLVLYKNVYSIPESTPFAVYTDKDYAAVEVGESRYEPYRKIILTFTPRYLSGNQEVYAEVVDEFLYTGQTLIKTVEFQKPVYRLVNHTTSGQLGSTFVASGYVYTSDIVEASSSSVSKVPVYFKVASYSGWYNPAYLYTGTPGNFIEVNSTNTLPSQSADVHILHSGAAAGLSIYLGKLSLYGRSLEGAKPQSYIRVIEGSSGVAQGYKELRLNDNPYIQDYMSAGRYTNIAAYLLANPRTVLTLTEVPALNSATLGATVEVQSNLMQVSGLFKVTAVKYSNTLATCSLSLVSLSGLVQQSNLYIIGDVYASSDEKYLGF